ncbi:glycosyltransferase family 4 protein [uncultured Planococcus sp.]|uniref:glycosyltransferase family 4 protein n=1 Tax=uncultured Planococcus sp. TaxID=337815 RepID=UPI00262FE44D|nr:glycosyltransferase family 4 protein [uncultured Planococcus sp.]
MKIMIIADGHYFKDSKGDIYVQSIYDYNYFRRYLKIFNEIFVLVRVTQVNKIDPKYKLVSGPGLHFLEISNFKGPVEYARNYFKLKKEVLEYTHAVDAAIFRIPSAISMPFIKQFIKQGKPFSLEVVADPWTTFAKGTIDSIFRPLIRISWTYKQKKYCKKANGVAYVTKEYLQKRYPSKSILNEESARFFHTNYSSVVINKNLIGEPKKYLIPNKLTISHVANSFSSYGKGHVILMDVVKKLNDNGIDASIIFIGDGPMMSEFKKYAFEKGIQKNVSFLGFLSNSNEVITEIKKTDLFVFPTKAEGLPRVVIEAMSAGLPVISSPVGGIPEILKPQFMVDFNDTEKLYEKIVYLSKNIDLLEAESNNNIEIAKEYTVEKLSKRRNEFYSRFMEFIS